MAAITAAAGGGNWTTGATWVGGVAPTTADDVFLDATSGNVTIVAGSNPCRSLNCTGYTGTLAMNASGVLSTGDATAGAGNIALLLSATMTFTFVSTANTRIDLFSTSSNVQTLTTGGKTMTTVNISADGGKYQLTDNFSSPAATLTLAQGTLDTNGQTCSWAQFTSSNSNVRTLTLGNSAITLTGSGVITWNALTATNLTVSANTAIVTMTGANPRFDTGNTNWNGLSIVMTGGGIAQIPFNNPTLLNFTRSGTAVKTDSLSFGGNPTITGTLTLTGNSVTNRLLVQSSAVGTARTLTAAAVSLTNVDFMDITGAGTAVPFTGTLLGDALGNSGITFDAPVTQAWQTTGSGSWSDVTKWTTRVPLPQDDITFAQAFVSAGITMDMPRLGKNVSFVGSTGGPTLTAGAAITAYGSVDFAAVGSVNVGGASLGITLAGRGSHTLTTSSTWIGILRVNAPGGTYTLGSDFPSGAVNGFGQSLLAGTLDGGGFNFSAGSLVTSGTSTLLMGSGTWTFGSLSGNIWNFAATATLNAGTSTIALVGATGSARTFAGGGKTYNNLTYSVANSPGSLTITGANTFNNLNIGSGRILTMPASTVNTVASGGTFNVNGVNNGYLYLPGVAGNYTSSPDSAALSIIGDIDIIVRMAAIDWTPSAFGMIISKAHSPGQSAYDLGLNTNGTFTLRTSATGAFVFNVGTSSVATGFVDGSTNWLRVTRSAATGTVLFYTAADSVSIPSSWAQLGASVASGANPIFDGTDQLEIGTNVGGATNFLNGRLYRALIYNGIGGTLAFDANLTNKPFGINTFTESSTNAATVTINGTLAQAGDGRVSLVSSTPGTPAILSKASGTVAVDYLAIQDSTATGGAAWYAGANSKNISGNSGWIFGALGATATKASNFLPFFGGSF